MLWLMNCLSLLNYEKKKSTAKPSRQKLNTNLRQKYQGCKMMVIMAAELSTLSAFK